MQDWKVPDGSSHNTLAFRTGQVSSMKQQNGPTTSTITVNYNKNKIYAAVKKFCH
jgi:hypothetical protein